MPFLTAFGSTEYNKLRGTSVIPPTYAASQFMCLGDNVTVLACRVNQSSPPASYSSITFDTVTTGAYTDVQEGQTVLVSHTNDKRAAYFVGRVRKSQAGTVSTSTVLNINETSAALEDNDYLWVINDYRLYHKLGRESSGTYYKDYGLTFTELKPIIYGLQSAYAGIVSGSPVGYTVAFTASAIAATSGATISSYAWTLPSGTTVTAGSTGSASVTVRFDAASTEYWVKLVVTDSGSRTQTRHIPVFAIPADLSTTVALGFKGAQITGDINSGWSANVEAFDDVGTVLDNTLAVIFDVEYYNGTLTNIGSNVRFVGRLRKENNRTETDEEYGLNSSTTFELESAAAQLGRISAPYITMQDAASPSAWDQVRKLTVWRAIAYMLEHSTFHELYSLSFNSVSDNFRAYQLEVDQGNIFDSVKSLAQAINANLEFTPTGELYIARDARYLDSTARSALATIANLTTNDAVTWNIDRDHVETVGLVEASGGTYAVTSMGITGAAVTPLLSIAPGTAQGNADGTTTLTRQVLLSDSFRGSAQTELNTRTGNHYAKENDEVTLSVDLLDGYHFLIPSASQWYTWTIAATDNTRGIAYTTSERWLLKAIDINHDNDTGGKSVTATFTSETLGTPGQTKSYPTTTTTTPQIPEIPNIPGYPNFPVDTGVIVPTDPVITELPPNSGGNSPSVINAAIASGNAVVVSTASHVYASLNFTTIASWIDITPDDILGEIQAIAKVGISGLYVLSSDNVNSVVHYSPNVYASNVWTASTSLADTYSQIAPSSTSSKVYIKGDMGHCDTYDFLTAAGTFTPLVNGFGTYGTWISGSGWQSTFFPALSNQQEVYISTSFPSGHLTSIEVVVNSVAGGTINVFGSGTTFFTQSIGTGTTTLTLSTDTVIDELTVDVDTIGVSSTDYNYVRSIELCFSSGGGGGGSTSTRYSSDNGATFASPVTAGTDAYAMGGLDTERVGLPFLIGTTGQVKIATTLGGTYSAYGSATPTGTEPNAIVIPRYQFGSTTTGNISTNTPQYLMGSSILGASNKAILKVTSSGATFTDITPLIGSDYGLTVGSRSLAIPWRSGSRIAGVLQFGSLPRLVVSTNAGASWTDRGVLDTTARMVTYRKGDVAMKQLYLTAGQPAYSPDHGASIKLKAFPSDYTTEPAKWIVVYG